ncbi:MAG: hypothetical protein ACYC2K_04495 [Gemmatimonadales bacterium]
MKQILAMLIPILALTIPIVAIAANSWVKVAKLKADAGRDGIGPGADERLAALEDEVAQLRGELVEAQERIDFTERLLTRNSEEAAQLNRPSN